MDEALAPAPPAYVPADSYSLETRKMVTFAQLESKIGELARIPPLFYTALEAFRDYMAGEEVAKVSREQLGVLRSLSVVVLEIGAERFYEGVDISETLIILTRTLRDLSSDIQSNQLWKYAIQNNKLSKYLETKIWAASEALEAELRKLQQGGDLEAIAYRDKLTHAQRIDREKTEEFEAIVKLNLQQQGGLNAAVQESMRANLKIISDSTVQHQQVEAKRALAILTELTGASLPSSTLLGKDFVTIGPHSIHSSATFEIYRGRYFTGEEIAIKLLRHRVDKETAKRTHERFARQTLNWSFLRHNSILPFYGVGVADSPVGSGEVQLYMVSPYLQNQDVVRIYQVLEDMTLDRDTFSQRQYLRKYPTTPLRIRLQMALDVARGLQHMHETTESPEQGNGIVHSALNIFNILIKDSGRAMISGFGHAKVIRDFDENFTGDNSEYRYMGPEMLQDEAKISHGTDIWSWAMTTLEILTDVPPFGEKTKGPRLVMLLAQLKKRPQRPDHAKIEQYNGADELWNLFTECWEEDPTARPSADEIVRRITPILRQLGRKQQAADQDNKLDGLPASPAGGSDSQSPPTPSEPPAPPIVMPGRSHFEIPDQQVVPAPSSIPSQAIRKKELSGTRDLTRHPEQQQSFDLVCFMLAQAVFSAIFSRTLGSTQYSTMQNSSNSSSDTISTTQDMPATEPPARWDVSVSRISTAATPRRLAPSSSERTGATISSRMSVEQMIKVLTEHGCRNVTDELNLASCSEYPVNQGGYGDVYWGCLQGDKQVAIKCPRMVDQISSKFDKNSEKVKQAAHEVYAASSLDHPNILKFLGVACFRNKLAMVSPWMENGSVNAYITANPNVDRCRIVARGLSYLHDEKLIHGDIKGDNVLVSPDGIAQIADFGNIVIEQYTLHFTGARNTPGFSNRWTPHEIIQSDVPTFTRKSDVYSLGMTVLEIITGEWPFHYIKNESAITLVICRNELPSRPQDSIPNESQDGNALWTLLTQCWSQKPEKRPSARHVEQVLSSIMSTGLV